MWQQPMWQQMNDEDLARAVRDALHWDSSIESGDITVVAKDGIVTLSGAVPTYAMRLGADRMARRVGAARGVVEHLEVRVPQRHARADGDIASAAANALRWGARVPDGHIKLSVDNGRITLDGQVPWHFQAAAAERAVRHLMGVTEVINNIRVAATMPHSDVRQHILGVLTRGAETVARDVTIEARDGTVTLRGTVRSWSQREDVWVAAWSAPGVRWVDDHLTISA
jgi:osmotically-inducible protein OsmY